MTSTQALKQNTCLLVKVLVFPNTKSCNTLLLPSLKDFLLLLRTFYSVFDVNPLFHQILLDYLL